MKIYEYNIKCNVCKRGFNPKNKETAFRKMCPKCLEIRKKRLEINPIKNKED